MRRFVDVVAEFDDFVATGGVENEKILSAEKALGLVFNKEYKDYVRKYGAACANGHELTGICDSRRLNVVEATTIAKNKNNLVPKDCYLLEDLGIDRLLTWQNSKGELFQTVGIGEPEKLNIELIKYIES